MTDDFNRKAEAKVAIESLSKTVEEYKLGLQRQSRYLMILSAAVAVMVIAMTIVVFAKTRPTRHFLATMPDGRLVEVRTFATLLQEDALRIQFVENLVSAIHSMNWRNRDEVLLFTKKKVSPDVYGALLRAIENSDKYNEDAMNRERLSSRAVVQSIRNLTPGKDQNQIFALQINKEVFQKGILVGKEKFYTYVELEKTRDLGNYPAGWVVIRYLDTPRAIKIDNFLKKRSKVRL